MVGENILSIKKGPHSKRSTSESRRIAFQDETFFETTIEKTEFKAELKSRISSVADPEVIDRLLEIMDTPYWYAEQAILILKSTSKHHHIAQVERINDAMRHIVQVLTIYAGNTEKQLSTLAITEDYLKRVSIESVRIIVDELYTSIQDVLKKPRFYYRFIFVSLPEKSKIDMHIEKIENYIEEGELRKNIGYWESSLYEYEKAYDEAILLKDLLPDPDEAKHKFFVTAISLVALVLSVILPLIFRFM